VNRLALFESAPLLPDNAKLWTKRRGVLRALLERERRGRSPDLNLIGSVCLQRSTALHWHVREGGSMGTQMSWPSL
jgi:hypothetical protein